MKLRMPAIILALVVVLSGCTAEGRTVERTNPPAPVTETAKSKATLDDVVLAMESQGLKLIGIHPKGGTSLFEKLNDTTAATFAIDTAKMEAPSDGKRQLPIEARVNIYVYVFDSEEARVEGRKAFDTKLELIKLAYEPVIIENKNVLVIHFKHPDEKAEYDQMIEAALQTL